MPKIMLVLHFLVTASPNIKLRMKNIMITFFYHENSHKRHLDETYSELRNLTEMKVNYHLQHQIDAT